MLGMPSGRVGWHECYGAFKAVAAGVSELTLLPQQVSMKGILGRTPSLVPLRCRDPLLHLDVGSYPWFSKAVILGRKLK